MDIFSIIFIFFSTLQVVGISIGMGSSTIAISNFFLAIKDGKIEDHERKFMGVAYFILRVAMVIILVTTTTLAFRGFSEVGSSYFTPYVITQFILISALYLNSLLMTLHLIPSTLGPAIQASSWYTLGFALALLANGWNDISLGAYMLLFLADFIVSLVIINGVMSYLKNKNKKA